MKNIKKIIGVILVISFLVSPLLTTAQQNNNNNLNLNYSLINFLNSFFWNYNNERIVKKKNRRVCKDSRALNFSPIGQHDERVCLYPWGWGENPEKKAQQEKDRREIRAKMCQRSMILFDQMEEGDENNKVSKETGKIVKEVKILQIYLKWLGLYAQPASGIYDRQTTEAVRIMQRKLNIEESGKIDKKTMSEFKNACK